MRRRDFLRAGLAAAALTRGRFGIGQSGGDQAVVLIANPEDPVASAAPARWALGELRRRLSDAGVPVRALERIEQADAGDVCIIASGARTAVAALTLSGAGVAAPEAPESLALLEARVSGRRAVLACAADGRGLAYALLELGDRVRPGAPPLPSLALPQPVVERPANGVRSLMRQFTSETLDKAWFYDRQAWAHYLTMLATHRFNRLHLAFGFGYDSLQRVTDSYFLFLYPFLLAVPGYGVRATNLPDAERDRNLETLRFISEEAVSRGLDFQLGIWMHGYALTNSPDARYLVEGLTHETHAAYCRDALTAVLRACPAISAVALRIHGESGIAEGSYEFWGTVFDGVARCGRAVEIDLHAKGLDAAMIERALATGMSVNVSPKFAAEHLGMPYHQAAIRELEMPVPGKTGAGLMSLSEGARVFTRYGFADFLREDRPYTVRPRVFSGTQRLLAWGSPAWAAAYARSFQFCGMTGADLMEPLTCRGRRGTGTGSRIGYADDRLAPRWDWEKYGAWYRAWGRMTYDPETAAEVFHRELGEDTRARFLESGLARASLILPIVTSAYLPSAACDAYWPEVYWNQPMVEGASPDPYFDSPSPKTFQNASPLDPQLFSAIGRFAEELLRGDRTGRYSPIEVARWLEDLARLAEEDLARAGTPASPDKLRIATDVEILMRLGRFFGAKLRSGVLYAMHERTGDRRALEEALNAYRRARAAWAELADRARGVYQPDLSASDRFSERGQWADRLAGIDRDIEQMAQRMASVTTTRDDPGVAAAIAAALGEPKRAQAACTHTPPPGFRPNVALEVALTVATGPAPTLVRLYYRHVNQAERWEAAAMGARGGAWRASIPAAYTDSPYPLQYYFELQSGSGQAWLHPGFTLDLSNQPYFVLRRI
jgi:hypothetical protein